MRARMAAYSAWNSAPSRLSHSSSDGVNGRGAEEIAGFGFGEDVDAEADVVPPVFVEEFAMLLKERVKRLGAQRKYLTSTARAQRGRQDDGAAVALDVAPEVPLGASPSVARGPSKTTLAFLLVALGAWVVRHAAATRATSTRETVALRLTSHGTS